VIPKITRTSADVLAGEFITLLILSGSTDVGSTQRGHRIRHGCSRFDSAAAMSATGGSYRVGECPEGKPLQRTVFEQKTHLAATATETRRRPTHWHLER
jgi:hypothetical protein